MTMLPYVIRAGDHLARLAHEMNFDAKSVWMDASNDGLRALRPNPQMLAIGDVLHVPERATADGQPLVSGTTNRFRARPTSIKVRLTFARGDVPWANEPWRVEAFRGGPITGATDGEGRFVAELPIDASSAVLVFPDRGVSFPLRIGHLDPVEEDTGVTSRLRHLGYLTTRQSATGRVPSADQLQNARRRAILGFQRDHGLPITGTMDDATRNALREVHGG